MMIHSQPDAYSRRHQRVRQRRNPVLQRHPILYPLLLLGSAAALISCSFSADSLFPLLVLFGIPTTLVCLLLAFVLGTCGILISIISIIERVEQYQTQAALVPHAKEHSR